MLIFGVFDESNSTDLWLQRLNSSNCSSNVVLKRGKDRSSSKTSTFKADL
jgi:hypothetical protein